MEKLKILFRLLQWLYTTEHPNGVRATINKREDGQEWFLVEPSVIWLSEDHAGANLVVINGQRYIKMGGGEHEGKYLFIGDQEPYVDEEGEPMTWEQWSRDTDETFGK